MNRKIDTGKTLTRWPVFVDHFIYTRGIGSKDMVVWHLMHIDKAINHTLEKFFPPA
ncbi:TPA: hypothetical protein HLY36_12755 [Escherichia coli]|nr:hypothetical protein [Salmonella enterica subsp. enterica serovar Agona]EFH8077894.1 hypothetical protein [Escherichia coli]EFH8096650.1 hypothetical protein [Escherichia coli]EFH8388989.1 hypothetical protein [Escherichia coli]EFH8855863.1 hypothetical protein [Escherichia coli]